MKAIKRILFIVLSFTSLLFIRHYAQINIYAEKPLSYEAPQNIGVYDLTDTGYANLNAYNYFDYVKTNEHGSVVFKFKFFANRWESDDDGFQFHLANTWDFNSCAWLRPDHIRLTYVKSDGSTGYIVGDAIEAGEHIVEYGRLAINKDGVYDGECYFYIKIDDVLYCEMNYKVPADTLKSNKVFLTTAGINRIEDLEYIPTYYEDAEVLSVGDLTNPYGVQASKLVLNKHNYLTHENVKPYGSTIFKFKYVTNSYKTDDDGFQLRFWGSWGNEGMFWFRPDKTRIAYNESASYVAGDPLKEGRTYDIEVGRLAIMKAGQFTGTCYLYIKVDGEIVLEHYNSNITSTVLADNEFFFTGSSNNVMIDVNWDGNTIKYVKDGQVINEIKTTDDYLTKPADVSKEGYIFMGWYDSLGNRWNFSNDMVQSDMTLTAGFMLNDGISDEEYFNDSNFTPTIRFLVSSDTHIGKEASIRDQRLTALFNIAYNYAASQNYKNLDAALFAGDVSDDGSDEALTRFKGLIDAGVRNGTTAIVSMGNHEFRTYQSAAKEIVLFEKIIGEKADRHVVINGYHFISLSPNINEGYNFTETKQEWLREQLKIAALADPNKPIFVMQHENIKGTVYGSEAWGMTELTNIIKEYPQVVDFSGHSHYPLTDERGIWQGVFTALSTGTLHYYELGINGYKNCAVFATDKEGGWSNQSNPASSHGEFQIVEVDENGAIRIIVIDIDNNQEIRRYYLRNIFDDIKFKYSFEVRSEAAVKPIFDPSSKLSVEVVNNNVTITIPQASCASDYVESYRLELYKNGELVQKGYALSDYFFYPIPEKVKASFVRLDENTTYTVKVYAVSVWNKECDTPLEIEFTTEGKEVISNDYDEISLHNLYSDSGNHMMTADSMKGYQKLHFNVSENNNSGSFILKLKVLYVGGDWQINFNNQESNDDLVWINSGSNNYWFIRDKFRSDNPMTKGLHIVEAGRFYINEGPNEGLTRFYLKVDGEFIYECISPRTFDRTGHIVLNFNSAFNAGGRIYDINDNVPVYTTPEYNSQGDYTFTKPVINWKYLGAEIQFDSPLDSVTFYLADQYGRVTEDKKFDGKFTIGDNGNFYHYTIKTNQFNVTGTNDGYETVRKIVVVTPDLTVANLVERVYKEEVLCDYDEINILDFYKLNNGVITSNATETTYSYNGTSPNYSAVIKYGILSGELTAESEFRLQLGTVWKYGCTMWIQRGRLDTIYFGWMYTNRPSDKFYVPKFESNTFYLFEQGIIRVSEGEYEGFNYVYVKLNDELVVGYYVDPRESENESYQVSIKNVGYTVVDISNIHEITFKDGSTTLGKTQVVKGLKVNAISDPVKNDLYFDGWYLEPTFKTRFDTNKNYDLDTDITLYAKFSSTRSQVRFVVNGEIYDTQYVGDNGYALMPKNPTITGTYKHVFDKWVYEGTNTPVDFTKTITGDVTFEATFKEYEYTIHYLKDGKEVDSRLYKESDKVIIGAEPSVPQVLGATGYWEYSDSLSNKDVVAFARYNYNSTGITPSSNITLNKYNDSLLDIRMDMVKLYLSIASFNEKITWLRDSAYSPNSDKQNIEFSWNDNRNEQVYYVYFSDNSEFNNAFIVETTENYLDYVGIFVPNTKYYWKVVGGTTHTVSETDTFIVSNTPTRFISAGTVYNMRDIGGWTTTDNKQVNYSLIYRGGQLSLDGPAEKSYMNDYSFKVFDYLGMKTEIELRGGFEHPTAQWNSAFEALYVSGSGYKDMFRLNTATKANYKAIFEALGDESNYPFYFHCSWGADRTGSLAFLINGLLGVPYEQLAEDYELTSFSPSGKRSSLSFGSSSLKELYELMIANYPADDLKGSIELYLRNEIGVSQEAIDNIRRIMLVDKSEDETKNYTVSYVIDGKIVLKTSHKAGTTAVNYDKLYIDRMVESWLYNGEPYDFSTPLTRNIILEAKFVNIKYENHDSITLEDLDITSDYYNPDLTHPYFYQNNLKSPYTWFSFRFEPRYVSNPNSVDALYNDGPHIEFGDNVWAFKAHIWLCDLSTVHMFNDGNEFNPTTFSYKFEETKSYEITCGLVRPLSGTYMNKDILVLIIDGEIIGVIEVNTMPTQKAISFAGTDGYLYNVHQTNTVNFYVNNALVDTKTLSRGELLTDIFEPEMIYNGKVFVGWYDEFGNKYDVTKEVYQSANLYAKYDNPTVSASIIDSLGNDIITSYKVEIGTKVKDIIVPSVGSDNLEFDGWYNGTTKLNGEDVVTEGMNLVGKFNVKENEPVDPVDPVDPIDPVNPENPKKGCKGALEAIALAPVLLGSLSVLAIKKKKEEEN